jgi:hypothetical protein
MTTRRMAKTTAQEMHDSCNGFSVSRAQGQPRPETAVGGLSPDELAAEDAVEGKD